MVPDVRVIALVAKDAVITANKEAIASRDALGERLWSMIDPISALPEPKPSVAAVLADPSLLVPFELHPDRQAKHVRKAQSRFDAEAEGEGRGRGGKRARR